MQPNSSARLHNPGSGTQIAVHAEHAVRDEQLALGCRQRTEYLARGVHVLVREHLDCRPAQAASVDDARVIQLVRHHDIVFGEDRRDGARVGGEPALKDDDGFSLLELGKPALQLHVDVHGARNGADRAGSDAELQGRFQRPLPQPGMGREPEIVVRRQVHDLSAVDHRPGALLAVEYADMAEQPLLFECFDLGGEVAERIGPHISLSETLRTV